MANRTIDLEPQAVANLTRAILDVTNAGYEPRFIKYDDYRPECGVTILARKDKGKLVRIVCKSDGPRSILEIYEIKPVVKKPAPAPAADPAPDPAPAEAPSAPIMAADGPPASHYPLG